MERIGRLISRALHAVDDESKLSEVKRDVQALCADFPLYASRLQAYDRALAAAAR